MDQEGWLIIEGQTQRMRRDLFTRTKQQQSNKENKGNDLTLGELQFQNQRDKKQKGHRNYTVIQVSVIVMCKRIKFISR